MNKEIQVFQQKAKDLRSYLKSSNIQDQIAAALPKWLTADRFFRVIFSSIMRNPKLLDCTRESILMSVMQCAQLGLEPILGRAYLIPYENKRNIGGQWIKVPEMQMQVGYQGLIDLGRRSGNVKDVRAEIAYQNDEFDLQLGVDFSLHHRPKFGGDRGEIMGAYAVWVLADEIRHFDFMLIEDIYERRARSQAYQYAKANPNNKKAQDCPWIKWTEEMIKKTVIKHSAKLVPASIEFMQAVEMDSLQDMGGAAQMVLNPLALPDTMPEADESAIGETVAADDEQFGTAFDDFAGREALVDEFNQKIEYKHVPGTKHKYFDFIESTAEGNNLTIDEVMKAAISSKQQIQIFLNAFKNWTAAQTGGSFQEPDPAGSAIGPGTTTKDMQDAGASKIDEVDEQWKNWVKSWIRLHAVNFKKFVQENLETFARAPKWVSEKAIEKYNKNVGEPWPLKTLESRDDSNSLQSGESGEGHSKGQGEIVQPGASQEVDFTQSDEFNELSMLQSRYPDIYAKEIGNLKIKSIDDVNLAIDRIHRALEAQGSGQTEVDDIPY